MAFTDVSYKALAGFGVYHYSVSREREIKTYVKEIVAGSEEILRKQRQLRRCEREWEPSVCLFVVSVLVMLFSGGFSWFCIAVNGA